MLYTGTFVKAFSGLFSFLIFNMPFVWFSECLVYNNCRRHLLDKNYSESGEPVWGPLLVFKHPDLLSEASCFTLVNKTHCFLYIRLFFSLSIINRKVYEICIYIQSIYMSIYIYIKVNRGVLALTFKPVRQEARSQGEWSFATTGP